MSQQANWKDIQDATQAAIAVAGGLPTIWRDQDANQPGTSYVGLSLGRVATVDVDWVDERYDDSQAPGSQIVLTLAGTREVMLQIEVWSSSTIEKVAEATARATCDAIVSRLRLPRAREALRAVGLTPFDPGPTNWVPTVVQAGFRGRASCDVRCRMPAMALQEYTDWIAGIAGYATIEDMADGADVTVAFDTGGTPDQRMFWGVAADPGSYDVGFMEGLLNSAGVGARQRTINFVQPSQTYDVHGVPTGLQLYAWVGLPVAIDGDAEDYVDGQLPAFEVGLNVVATLTRQGVAYHLRRTDFANLGAWVLNIL